MFLDHAAERLDHAGFRDEKQQRKRAVAVLVILGHQVVDGFVQQPESARRCRCAALFRRSVAQRIVHERRRLIGIHLIKIADRFLSHCGRRIVQQFRDLFERSSRSLVFARRCASSCAACRKVAMSLLHRSSSLRAPALS
jgi:hypothetical protein